MKNKYIIKFSDGTYLCKGSPRYYKSIIISTARTEDVTKARVFNDLPKADKVKGDLKSLVSNIECEINYFINNTR